MKLDFWFDLPNAILPLVQNTESRNQFTQSAKLLSTAVRIIAKSMSDFQNTLVQVPREQITDPEKLKSDLKARVRNIQKEKTELFCKAAQLSTVLLRNVLQEIDSEDLSADKVQRVKLVLKLIKVVGQKAKDAQKESEGKQKKFFEV